MASGVFESLGICAPINGEGFSSVTALTLLTLSRVYHRCLIEEDCTGLLARLGDSVALYLDVGRL